jgi:hypothetical protein
MALPTIGAARHLAVHAQEDGEGLVIGRPGRRRVIRSQPSRKLACMLRIGDVFDSELERIDGHAGTPSSGGALAATLPVGLT